MTNMHSVNSILVLGDALLLFFSPIAAVPPPTASHRLYGNCVLLQQHRQKILLKEKSKAKARMRGWGGGGGAQGMSLD